MNEYRIIVELLEKLRECKNHIIGTTGALPGSDSEALVLEIKNLISKYENYLTD